MTTREQQLHEIDMDLLKKLWTEGKTVRQMADILGCSMSTVGHRLNSLGLHQSREWNGTKEKAALERWRLAMPW